jgi:hypothetical protein
MTQKCSELELEKALARSRRCAMGIDDGESVNELKAIGRKVLGFVETNKRDVRSDAHKDAYRNVPRSLGNASTNTNANSSDDTEPHAAAEDMENARRRDADLQHDARGPGDNTQERRQTRASLSKKNAQAACEEPSDMQVDASEMQPTRCHKQGKEVLSNMSRPVGAGHAGAGRKGAAAAAMMMTRTRSLERDLQWSVYVAFRLFARVDEWTHALFPLVHFACMDVLLRGHASTYICSLLSMHVSTYICALLSMHVSIHTCSCVCCNT